MTFEQIKNSKAITITLVIHAVLLLIFFLVKFQSVALPALTDTDLISLETVPVSVALGIDQNGFGIEPPEMVMDMPAPPTEAKGKENQTQESTPEANHTETEINHPHQDDVVATNHPSSERVLNQSGNPKNTGTKNTTTTKPKNNTPVNNNSTSNNTQKAKQPKYVMQGGTGNGGNGADQNAAGSRNRGNGTGNGMMGQLGGDPNSINFSGTVVGRSIVSRPSSNAEFSTGGKVTIKVWVNRDGVITRHVVQSAGNSTIRALAEQKLKGVRFNKSASAPAEQSGTIVMNFKAGK